MMYIQNIITETGDSFSILIHFIHFDQVGRPNSTSVMKKIAFDQYSITFYTSVWFHIAFALNV